MRTYDQIISLKLPASLFQQIEEKAFENRVNRSAFVRGAIEKALRDEPLELGKSPPESELDRKSHFPTELR